MGFWGGVLALVGILTRCHRHPVLNVRGIAHRTHHRRSLPTGQLAPSAFCFIQDDRLILDVLQVSHI